MHPNPQTSIGEGLRKITSGVYKISSLNSGNFYIGSAVNIASRWSLHRHQLSKHTHCNTSLQRAWDKYGIDGLIFSVVEFVPDPTKLIEREQYWIDTTSPQYNILKRAGNLLGFKHRPESIEKMRIASTGKKKSPETLAKLSASLIGRKHSEERKAAARGKKRRPGTGAKISASNMGRIISAETRAKISATKKRLGQTVIMTPEVREKLRKSKIGYRHPPEVYARQAEKMRGRKHTLETRMKMSATRLGKKLLPQHCNSIDVAKTLNPSGFADNLCTALVKS